MKREISLKELSLALRRAAQRSIKLNKVLGLSYKVVRNGNLIEIFPDGSEKILRKAAFDTVTVKNDKFKLKHG